MPDTNQKLIDRLNNHSLTFLTMLGAKIIALDIPNKTCTFEFNVSTDFCHSVDIIQGGFVTAMLDAAMSHAIFATDSSIVNISSLEIKTSYLEPSRAGKLTVIGDVIKAGYKTAFMEGRIYNSDNVLTATASSVGKIVRDKS